MNALLLGEFLLARIAADEGAARAALNQSDRFWGYAKHGGDVWVVDADNGTPLLDPSAEDLETAEPIVAHAARFDPARVLAECEAKRRIMALHPARWAVVWHDEGNPVRLVAEGEKVKVAASGGPIYDMELRLLALPYADHPDYRQEWKP